MRAIIAALAFVGMVGISAVRAEPVTVSLGDYAFNFAEHGYEITVEGTTGFHGQKKTTDDFIWIYDDGYSLWSRIDRLSRSDRQSFLDFYNAHCEWRTKCTVSAAGEVELDSDLKMIFLIRWAELSKDGKTLRTGAP